MTNLQNTLCGSTIGEHVKYHEYGPDMPSKPLRLPWPMTSRELLAYLVALIVVVPSSIAFVLWLSFEMIEPSLWRIVPAIVWMLVLRGVIIPAVTNALAPKDLRHRWAVIERERQEGPPTGAIQ